MRVLKVRNYKAGYRVQTEEHEAGEDEQKVVVRSAYTPGGDYLGDPQMARFIIVRRGLLPEKADPSHSVCSIGLDPRDSTGRWYGWSHRAIAGFGIGDKLFDPEWRGDHTEEEVEHMTFRLRGEFVITTLEQAKEAARRFAGYVS